MTLFSRSLPALLCASLLTTHGAFAAPAPASAEHPVAAATAGAPVVLDRIVAVVNKEIILESQLVNDIALVTAQMKARGITPPSVADLQGQVLEHMITTRVQLQRATEAGIKANDQDVNAAIDRVAKQNNVTSKEFLSEAKAQGVSIANLRREIHDQILIQELRQKEVTRRLDVTDQDVDLFLANGHADSSEEYHLSHILVSIPDNATPEQRAAAEAKADKILAELRSGGDFTQIAIRHSDGQQALQGGDLGWRKASDLPTLFASVVPTLKVGEVSNVIRGLNGYNIVKLDDKRSSEPQQTVVETDVQHLQLKPSTIRDAKATAALAQSLYKQIEGGADFGKLAKRYSDDTQTKNEGGNTGWQPPEVFSPELMQHIDALAKGQVGQPFELNDNWHIVKLLGRRTVNVTEKIRRQRARMAIMQQRETTKYEDWLRQLRASAYIEIRLKSGWITDADVAAAQS